MTIHPNLLSKKQKNAIEILKFDTTIKKILDMANDDNCTYEHPDDLNGDSIIMSYEAGLAKLVKTIAEQATYNRANPNNNANDPVNLKFENDKIIAVNMINAPPTENTSSIIFQFDRDADSKVMSDEIGLAMLQAADAALNALNKSNMNNNDIRNNLHDILQEQRTAAINLINESPPKDLTENLNKMSKLFGNNDTETTENLNKISKLFNNNDTTPVIPNTTPTIAKSSPSLKPYKGRAI